MENFLSDSSYSFYSQEIAQQPDLFRSFHQNAERQIREIARMMEEQKIEKVLCMGCGDAYANAMFGAQCWNDLCGGNVYAEAVEPFELLHRQESVSEHTAIIICSVKGRSKLVLDALEPIQERAIRIAITNEPQSPIARQSDRIIELHAGSWTGPRTKVYTLTSYALLLLAAAFSHREEMWERAAFLGDQVEELLKQKEHWKILTDACTESTGVTFVTYGRNISTAYMGRAKYKEVLRWEANLYQIEEFAHTETVAPAPGRYTIFCCEESPLLTRVGEVVRIAQDQLERRVVVISNRQTWETLQKQGLYCPHIIVPGNKKVSEPILQSIAVQILPFYIAKRLGIAPDHPPLREMARKTAFVEK